LYGWNHDRSGFDASRVILPVKNGIADGHASFDLMLALSITVVH